MTKILDWSATGYLTAAIQSSIHLWSCRTQSVQYTIDAVNGHEPSEADGGGGPAKTVVGCVKWDAQGVKLGYSFTVERDEAPSFDSSGEAWDGGGASPHALLRERTDDPQLADVTYRSPSAANSSADETSRRNGAAAAKSVGRVKVRHTKTSKIARKDRFKTEYLSIL